MNTQLVSTRCWSTASFGHPPQVSPVEISALGAHLRLCQQPHVKLAALQCMAQSMHGFVAARFVTTLVLVLLLIACASLLV
jgi:hypothetical protein